MPIYEYKCHNCGHKLETMQRMQEAPLVDCPACNAPKLVKLISAAGFQLKGTGWYVTDFRNSGKKPSAEKTPAASSETPVASATESAPAKPTSEAS